MEIKRRMKITCFMCNSDMGMTMEGVYDPSYSGIASVCEDCKETEEDITKIEKIMEIKIKCVNCNDDGAAMNDVRATISEFGENCGVSHICVNCVNEKDITEQAKVVSPLLISEKCDNK